MISLRGMVLVACLSCAFLAGTGCATRQAVRTAPTRAPSLAPITRDFHDAKASVGRAYKSSVRLDDYRSRIEFKATRILERWGRKP